MGNNSYTTAIIVGIILVIFIAGAYLFLSSQNASPTPTTSIPQENTPAITTPSTTAPTSTVTPGTTQSSQVKPFTVSAQNFSFSPNEIRVKKGDTVKIILQNQGGLHDWVVDEFNVHTQRISDGSTDQVEFVADKTGTFQFYCSVDGHRQMGMKGNLIVE